MKVTIETNLTELLVALDVFRDWARGVAVQPAAGPAPAPAAAPAVVAAPAPAPAPALEPEALEHLQQAARDDWQAEQAEQAEESDNDTQPARRDWWAEIMTDATERCRRNAGKRPTQSELRGRYGIGYSTATRLVDKLVADGVVQDVDMGKPLPDPRQSPVRVISQTKAAPAQVSDDDDDDNGEAELAKQAAALTPPAEVLDAIRQERSHNAAILRLLAWRGGERTSAAYIFEVLRTQRHVTVGSLTKVLQDLVNERKISKVDRAVYRALLSEV